MITCQKMQRECVTEQRTSDGYFNATKSLSVWNVTNPACKKDLKEFQKLKGTQEFIEYLKTKEGITKPYISSNKGTWMCPLLFVDFAMWVSLEFKAQAIKWIIDGLIFQRNQAGDYANELKGIIMQRYLEAYDCKPPSMIYMNEFSQLKDFVGITDRNKATEQQLQTLNVLQKFDIKLIKEQVGKVSRYKQLKQLAEALS